MSVEEAIHKVMEEYAKASALYYVRNPVAYALYTVWREADRKGERT